MNNIILCVFAFVTATHASGEVRFLYYPKNIAFSGKEIVNQSILKEILSACLGFTTSQNSDWTGLRISDPFNYPEASVTLVVDGIETLEGLKGHQFDMSTDEDEDVTWLAMERRVRNRFPSQNNTLMRVELSEGPDAVAPYYHLLGEVESPILPDVQFLDLNVTEDKKFVAEVSLLQGIVKKINSGSVTPDGATDVYWFIFRQLHTVLDMHGDGSPAAEEAKQLLQEAVTDITSAFANAYEGRVLVSLITSDVSHTRQARSAQSGEDVVEMRVAGDYEEEYPVIFNICLWFMVLFVMSLIAICISIMRMDPGRDSIIYRMTTMKSMKKEN